MSEFERDDYGRQIAEMYTSIRQLAFQCGFPPGAQDEHGRPKVWALVTDMGRAEGVFTLNAMSDGTVSIYVSSGGGYLGLGEHEGPRAAAAALLAQAPVLLEHQDPAAAERLPAPNEVAFNLITADGVYRAVVTEAALREGHPLLPLYASVHRVITVVRLQDPGS